MIDMSDEVASLECPGYESGPNDDVSGSPILVTLPSGRDVLVAGQESSRITALDPDGDGAVLWVAQAQDATASPQGAGMGPASDGTLYLPPRGAPGRDRRHGRTAPGHRRARLGTPPTPSRTTARTPTHPPAPRACSGPRPSSPAWSFAGGRDGMLRAYSTPGRRGPCGSTTPCATSRPITAWSPAAVPSADTDPRSSEACCSSVRATRYSRACPATCCSRSGVE